MPISNPGDLIANSDYPKSLKPNLTRWVIPGWYFGASINYTVSNGRIVYMPIFVEELTTYIRIALNVSGAAAGGTIEMRIYTWANGVPGSLILNCGSISTTTTGLKEIVINQPLARGYYFLAFRGDAAAAGALLYGFDPVAAVNSPVAGTLDGTILCLYIDGAWANPAAAPTGGLTSQAVCLELREN